MFNLALAVVIQLQAAPAIKWDEIWDQPGVATIYVDPASVSGSNDLRSITTRTVYKNALPDGYIAECIRTEEFDCVRHRSRIRQVTIIANDARPPQTVNWTAGKSTWQSSEPETLGAKKYEIACTVPPGKHDTDGAF